jgi:hypothetical protein
VDTLSRNQNRREDDRSLLAPGETIVTAGSQPVAALTSRKIVAGADDTYSSDINVPAPVAAKHQHHNWKQNAVRVPAIAIKNSLGSSTDDSKISGATQTGTPMMMRTVLPLW